MGLVKKLGTTIFIFYSESCFRVYRANTKFTDTLDLRGNNIYLTEKRRIGFDGKSLFLSLSLSFSLWDNTFTA